MELFSCSYYNILNPSCSDHSPIEVFWEVLTFVFGEPQAGNSIVDFYKKLDKLKDITKSKHCAPADSLSVSYSNLQEKQWACFLQLEADPLTPL
ncbi:hypothetical protein M5K25_004664 [Dendrobium thyrsiflorum]|uniref:Uncharacterized protein n=1 Tax=Dendrobium thyrsiflorum TaxID=117978 RepID=A0ABD0VFR5_DENTH